MKRSILRVLIVTSIAAAAMFVSGCGDIDFFEKTLKVKGPVIDEGLIMDPGDRMINGIICVYVPGGTFLMGSPEEEPGRYPDEEQVSVTVSPFWIAKYPITNRQFYGASLPAGLEGKGNHPAAFVTWDTASVFAARKGGKLPTEAQWELAARGGGAAPADVQALVYSGSNDPNEVAWYRGDGVSETQPVLHPRKNANRLGIYGMSGNVYEWTADLYAPRSGGTGRIPTILMGTAMGYIHKGGGFKSPARDCRVADRAYSSPGAASEDIGFRIVFDN